MTKCERIGDEGLYIDYMGITLLYLNKDRVVTNCMPQMPIDNK